MNKYLPATTEGYEETETFHPDALGFGILTFYVCLIVVTIVMAWIAVTYQMARMECLDTGGVFYDDAGVTLILPPTCDLKVNGPPPSF